MALSSDFEVIVPGKKVAKQPMPNISQQSMAQPQQMAQTPKEEEPSFLSKLGGTAANLGLSAATGLAQIPANALDLAVSLGQAFPAPHVSETGQITTPRLSEEQRNQLRLSPKVESVSEDIRKQLPQQFDNAAVRFTNKVAQALPAFYAPGGGFTNALARAFGSEGGKALASNAGLGELGQFFGSVAGAGLASGLLTQRNLKNLENLNYNEFEKSIKSGAEAKLPLAQKSYNNILKNADLDPDASEWLSKNLKFLEPALRAGKEGVKTSFEKLKKLNAIIRDKANYLKEPIVKKEVKSALEEISKNLKQDIVDSASDNPGLYVQGLVDGSSISYARNNSGLTRKLLKYIGVPLGGAGLVATPYIPLAAKALTGKVGTGALGIGLGTKGILDPLLMAYQSPAAREEILGRALPQTLAGILGSQK